MSNSPVNYSQSSPYAYTPQNSYYLDFWVPPPVRPSASDNFVVLDSRYNNRPDLLSYDLYGTPMFWWVFAMVNPDIIRDPIWDCVAGITLRVPDPQSLQNYVNNS
jgi:hypothetical protein